ncbi:MAG: dATP/dGTP diphosphohydrolase domain-containing protein, partial [Plesiomonas shigelloides]
MKLLELLCEELPKRGGWPESAVAAVQNNKDGMYRVVFVGEGYNISPRKYHSNRVGWTTRFDGGTWGSVKANIDFNPDTLASDHATRIVTREEYEAVVTPRVVPRRSDVLASLVGNLKQWPTEITDDLPHFIGWAWKQLGTEYVTLESDEHGIITSDNWKLEKAPSVKHDHGKPLMGALPANAELAVARVLTFGAEKYGRDNWRGLDDS